MEIHIIQLVAGLSVIALAEEKADKDKVREALDDAKKLLTQSLPFFFVFFFFSLSLSHVHAWNARPVDDLVENLSARR